MSDDTVSTGPTPDGGVVAVDSSSVQLNDDATEQNAADTTDESVLAQLANSSLLTLAHREYRLAVRSRWALGVALL
ncbi:MAG: ABC transporter permease, partial [Haloarcula sp.]